MTCRNRTITAICSTMFLSLISTSALAYEGETNFNHVRGIEVNPNAHRDYKNDEEAKKHLRLMQEAHQADEQSPNEATTAEATTSNSDAAPAATTNIEEEPAITEQAPQPRNALQAKRQHMQEALQKRRTSMQEKRENQSEKRSNAFQARKDAMEKRWQEQRGILTNESSEE